MLAAAHATRDEATHEDNKAESKYDTRGLEASYLAEAQACQAEEAEEHVARFESMPLREFQPEDPIALGALVEVALGGYVDLYMLAPGAGGKEFEIDGRECTLVTADSPMGARLLGLRQGARFDVNGRDAEVKTVC